MKLNSKEYEESFLNNFYVPNYKKSKRSLKKFNGIEFTAKIKTYDMENKSNQDGNLHDLPDSLQDQDKLKPELTTINLPDVEDIPGQEHVRPAPLGEMADTTIASDDEEGVGLFDDEDEKDIEIDNKNSSNLTSREKRP